MAPPKRGRSQVYTDTVRKRSSPSKPHGWLTWRLSRFAAAAGVGLLGVVSAGAELSGQDDPSWLTVALWSIVATVSCSCGVLEIVQGRKLEAQDARQIEAVRHRNSARNATETQTHFEARSRGVPPFGNPSGWHFTGRAVALSEIVKWLSGLTTLDTRARIVTGGPGSGKSALLGRLVAMSHPELRSRIPQSVFDRAPAGTVCPAGVLAAYIYARGRTIDEIAAEVAHGLGLDASTSEQLLFALSKNLRPMQLGVVVDAIDEAVEPGRLVRDLLAPLARMTARSGVYLVAGTRPGQDKQLIRGFGYDCVEIDLDSEKYYDREDVVKYAESLLVVNQEKPPGAGAPRLFHLQQRVANIVARAVAEKAGYSFLVAYLSCLALARDRDAMDAMLPDWEVRLPASVGDAMEQYFDGLGPHAVRVRDLLAPLAFAEGDGLTTPIVWAEVASVIGTAEYTVADVGWLLAHPTASDLMIRTGLKHDSHAEVVAYRLFHEALAEHLRRAASSRFGAAVISRAIVTALIGAVPEDSEGGGRLWSSADHYTRTYLSEHAAAGAVIDSLLLDFSFLVVAEPRRLLRSLCATTTDDGCRMADALSRVGRQFLLMRASERLSYLELSARKSGQLSLAARIGKSSSHRRPWSVPWANWAAPAGGRAIGHHGLYIDGLAIVEVGGRSLVAAADQNAIRLWDPNVATAVREFSFTDFGAVQSLTATSAKAGTRVITRHAGGGVAFWDPATGSSVSRSEIGSDSFGVVMKLAPDLVLTGDSSSYLTLWRASDATAVRTINVPTGVELKAAGRLNGLDLAVLWHESQRAIYLWNLEKQEAVGTPLILHEGTSLWSSAIGIIDGSPKVIIAMNGKWDMFPDGVNAWIVEVDHWPSEKQDLPGLGWGPMSTVLWSGREGAVMSVGGADGMIRRFEWIDGQFCLLATTVAHDGGVDHLCFLDHEGRMVEVSGGRDGVVRSWLTSSDKRPIGSLQIISNTAQVVIAHGRRTKLLGLDSDGRLNSYSVDTGVRIDIPAYRSRHLQSKTVTGTASCEIHGREILLAAFKDGWIAMVDGGKFDQVAEFCVSGGYVTELAAITWKGASIAVCAVSDGTIACYDLNRQRWTTRSQRIFSRWDGMRVLNLDGRWFAVALGSNPARTNSALHLWDIQALEISSTLSAFEDADSFHAVAAGRLDGRPVAITTGYNSAVRAWDLRSGRLIMDGTVDDGHCMEVGAISIDRLHGRDVVLSGGYAGALSIWNLNGDIFSVIEVGNPIGAWKVVSSDSLIVSGPMGTLKIKLAEEFLSPRKTRTQRIPSLIS